ncbi:MAG: hypothetical protein AAB492_05030 [Patescibacteria group bacterium]
MQHLKQKIKETTLFSDEDKIAILAAMDSYEVSDRNALEKIIDEFDQTYRQSVAEYKKAVGTTLDTIFAKAKPAGTQRLQSATSQIKSGVDMLLAP